MEWRAIVLIIINPPTIVSVLGFSVITNQTQRGPKMVSSKKKRLTSGAVMYLGAKVIKTKGIVTHAMHSGDIYPHHTDAEFAKKGCLIYTSDAADEG